MTRKINHLEQTLYFSILGLFIPGFTAIVIIGIRLGLESITENCELTWNIVAFGTGILAIIAPVINFKNLEKVKKITKARIWTFNLIEYTLIQSALVLFWVNANSSCNGHPAQNGLEYAFTAWMGIPIILGINLIFDGKIRKNRHNNGEHDVSL